MADYTVTLTDEENEWLRLRTAQYQAYHLSPSGLEQYDPETGELLPPPDWTLPIMLQEICRADLMNTGKQQEALLRDPAITAMFVSLGGTLP